MNSLGLITDYRSADISRCRKYRYTLWRRWDRSKPIVLFIGLNPSTADEKENDNTIRRCINFAKDWGFGGICMANLFAFRATEPKDMKTASDPIGKRNDWWLRHLSNKSDIRIACWGVGGDYLNRDQEVINILPNLCCLGVTKEGFPKHPLYLKKETKVEPYEY